MFNFILMTLSFGLFIAGFIALVIDLTSKKRNENRVPDEKLPRLGKYSFLLSFLSLFLLVFVSFAYAPL
ncbi:MAG: hypothetical protein EAX89_09465 [Candidatus Lokiarchaeota archaeon]|nr:hypothetical protein [Candidatus Lokiarchaeota archaeon]